MIVFFHNAEKRNETMEFIQVLKMFDFNAKDGDYTCLLVIDLWHHICLQKEALFEFDTVDTDHNGKIDFNEFQVWFKNRCGDHGTTKVYLMDWLEDRKHISNKNAFDSNANHPRKSISP